MSIESERAKEILADEVFQKVISLALGDCVARWASPSNTTDDREKAYYLFRAIEEVQNQLQIIAESADFEEAFHG